jgi:hypothetical protein
MARQAPPWIAHREVVDDAERYAAMTPEERLAVFVEVCELARTILEGRPDRARVLSEVEPLPPTAEAAWRRLVAESRRGRSAR